MTSLNYTMNNDIIKVSKPFTLLTPNNMLITTEVVVIVAIVSDRDNVTLSLVVKLH